MILTGSEITKEVENGKIVINPFDLSCVNPNSYNFKLSNILKVYNEKVIDTYQPNRVSEIIIPDKGYVLQPNKLYLASTIEQLGSEHYVPTYAARSSIARLGMFINLSAPLGDIGFVGCWTLQLFVLNRIRVYPNMRIGQMMFWKPQGKIELYKGKYQHASGPMSSQIHKDAILNVISTLDNPVLKEEDCTPKQY